MAIGASRAVKKSERNDAQIDWGYPPLTSLANLAQIDRQPLTQSCFGAFVLERGDKGEQ